jgi:cytochrome c5
VNQQDRSFMVTFTMVMSVLVLIAIAIFLISKLVSTLTVQPQDSSRRLSRIEERIKPVYRVVVAATSAEATAVPATPAAPAAAPKAEAAPAEKPPSAPAQAASANPAAASVPANVDLAHGKQLFNTVCAACHQTGVAGAPKLGDKAAWAPRIAQGFDTLVEHALKGYKAMPPKGGAVNLPDQEIISAVGYVVSEGQ